MEKTPSHTAADAPATVTQLKTESDNSGQANLQAGNEGAAQQNSQLDVSGSAKKQPDANGDPSLQARTAAAVGQPVETGAIAKTSLANASATGVDLTAQATNITSSTVTASASATGISPGSAAALNAPSAPQTGQPSTSASLPSAATAAPSSPAVTGGQLIQHANQSEIRVSLDSTTLGPVELRATMRNDTLSAAIGVTKSDVQTFLAAELPSLHHTLAEHNLRVESLTLTDRSFDARSGLSQGSQEQGNQNLRPYLAVASTASSDAEDANSHVPIPAEGAIGDPSGGRLSIHA